MTTALSALRVWALLLAGASLGGAVWLVLLAGLVGSGWDAGAAVDGFTTGWVTVVIAGTMGWSARQIVQLFRDLVALVQR